VLSPFPLLNRSSPWPLPACLPSLCPPRFLQGAAHTAAIERGEAAAAAAVASHGPAALAVGLLCRCDEVPDEGVEVLLLRGLLTAGTSGSFSMHGQALLAGVRTCYNIHLMSRSAVNQTTARAALTQILNVTFQRMEAGALRVAVRLAT
jgi:Dimerisation and cyclophilin-binding domain of Mon2